MVRTKVCHYVNGLYTNGFVTEVRTTTASAGKKKTLYTTYVIQFEDREKLVCGLDTVREMIACFLHRSKTITTDVAVTHVPRELFPEGKTSDVKVKKQKTTRRKPRKRSKKQPQHVLADDTGHEADNQTSSGTFL